MVKNLVEKVALGVMAAGMSVSAGYLTKGFYDAGKVHELRGEYRLELLMDHMDESTRDSYVASGGLFLSALAGIPYAIVSSRRKRYL